MNERIKELVRQAVIAVDDPFPGNPLNDELEKMYIPDFFSEKFAELIVKECAKVVDDKLDFENASGPDDWASGADVLAHFGVEE